MPIFDIGRRSVLFVHIPKAAGSSTTKWLSEHGKASFVRPRPVPPFRITPQHFRWRDYDYLLDAPVFDYAFAIVRDPFSRFESEYFWAHRAANATGEPWDDFSHWAERQIIAASSDLFHADNHFCPQVNFLAAAVKVFKVEEGLDNIVAQISEALEIPPPEKTPHLNARSDSAREIKWSGDVIELVRDFYSVDFAEFGYDPMKISASPKQP